MYLLEVGPMATMAGDLFGAPECIRFSYETSEDMIVEAEKRIKEAMVLNALELVI